MTVEKTFSWNAADYLNTQEDIIAYLEAALEEGDPSLIIAALGDIIRSQGMTHITRETDLSSKNLDLLPTQIKILHDLEIDAIALIFNQQEIETSEEIVTGIIVDYTEQGQIVSIEILEASKQLPLPELLESVIV